MELEPHTDRPPPATGGPLLPGPSPLRDLLALLPTLSTYASGAIDYEAVDANVLQEILSRADSAIRTGHAGISAIGLLLGRMDAAVSSPAAESTEAAAAIGRLLADLGEVIAHLYQLSLSCRVHLTDYAP